MSESTPSRPLNLFFSYSHKDQELRDDLESHLSSLRRQGLIAGWHDRKISAGSEWKGQIDENLNRASIILLLVSSDFLNSDYCYDREMKRALERDADKEARVIPVILRPCDWTGTPISGLQAIPTGGKAVTKWDNQDEAFLNVAQEIGKVVRELNEVSIEHYANWVKRWGVFEGIGRPLSDEEVARRQNSIRFHRKAGRIEKVQIVNGQGQLTGTYDNLQPTELRRQESMGGVSVECQWEFVRGEDGTVLDERAKDQANRFVYALHYVPGQDPARVTAHYVDAAGFPVVRANSGAASLKVLRSQEGFDREVSFYDKAGTPQPDDNGSYGEVRELSTKGQAVRVTNLGFDGKPAWRKDGYAQFRFEYDAQGNATLSECLGLDGKPALHTDGYSRIESTFDASGNQIKTAFLDENKNPVRTRNGFAVSTAQYDERGRLVEVAYFDETGNPARQVEGYHKWAASHDPRGRVIEIQLWDESDRLVRGRDGFARWTAQYDAKGNPFKREFFDESGKPVRTRDGFAKLEYDFDELGRVTQTRYFDESEKLAVQKDGYAKEMLEYDDRGYVREAVYRDASDHPARLKEGYASWKAAYDDRGKMLEWTCFDENQSPVRNLDGYSTRINGYGKRGNNTWEEYFDESSQPAPEKDDKQEGDSDKRRYSKSHFVLTNRRRALHRKGYAGWTARYDERGFRNFTGYIGVDGQPTLIPEGYAAWLAENDERGNRKQMTFLGLDLRPIKLKGGYAGWKATYDKNGNRVTKTLLNEADQAACGDEGYATVVSKFDWRGNEIEVSYRDEADKPVRHRDGFLKCVRTYDDWGVIVGRVFSGFDKSAGFSELHSTYDEQGREIEQWYVDEMGQPVRHKDGHARWTKTYDEQGNLKEHVFCGYAGPGQLSTKSLVYDPVQNTATETFLDSANRLTASPAGYARLIWKYDKHGNGIEARQDERGKVIQVRCLNSEGRPVSHQEGWSKWKRDYDEHGRIGESYFGPNDEPLTLAEGYAAWRIIRDESGREKELEFLNPAGQRVRCNDGYATRTLKYDSDGNAAEVAFLDEAGRRVRIKEGYAGQFATYDAERRRIEVCNLDEAGQPTADVRGVARWKARYDESGNRIEITYYDAAGNVLPAKSAHD